MSNFVEERINIDVLHADAIEWSRADGSHILAVSGKNSTNNDVVAVYSEVGTLLDIVEGSLHNDERNILLAWNPKFLILAIVWSDAKLTYWIGNDMKSCFEKGAQQHSHDVYFLEWSPDGAYILIGIQKRA